MPSFSGENVGSIYASLDLDRDPFARGLAAAREEMRRFEAERHRVQIDAKLNKDSLADLRARMKAVTDRHYELKVKIAEAGAAASLKKLEAELKVATRNRDIKIKIDTDTNPISRLTSKLAEAMRSSDALAKHGTLAKVAVGGIAVAPQLLGSLGAGTLGAGALGVAGAGAALSFGALGYAVKNALTTQGQYASNVRAVSTAQVQLNKDQMAGASTSLAVQKAQNAVTAAQNRGVSSKKALTATQISTNQQLISSTQQHLAIVTASANAQMANNSALIQADKLKLHTAQQTAVAYNALAQRVRDSFGNLQDQLRQTLAPAVNEVFRGMLTAMSTVKSALPGLTAPFQALGAAVHHALSSPATQAGIRALIDGFGKMTRAAAPLVGPILKGVLALGKIFLNIATAAMPELVKVVSRLAGWLTKVAAHTANTAKFREQIHHMVTEFLGWVHAAINLGKALWPLFSSAAGFLPLLNVVIGLVGAFVKLLASLGPVGRLLAGGLGLALLAGKFAMLRKALLLTGGAFKLAGLAALGMATKDFGPLLTVFPKLGKGLELLSGGLGKLVPMFARVALMFARVALAAAPWLIALALIAGAVYLVIKYHKQIWEVVKTVWHAIETVIKTVVGFIVKHLWLFMGPLGVIIHFHKQIEHAIKAAWEAIKKAIGAAVKFIGHLLSAAWQWIEHAAAAAWHAITNVLHKAWEMIKNAVVNGVKAVVQFVASLPGKAIHALGDIAKTLFDSGVKLIQGLIDGIISMIGNVLGVVGHLVDQVTGAIGGLLGIHSPSTVAHGWGQAIGQGLANGVHASVPIVTAAMRRLSQSATGSASFGVTSAFPTAALGQSPPSTSSALVHALDALRVAVTALTRRLTPALSSASSAYGSASTATHAMKHAAHRAHQSWIDGLLAGAQKSIASPGGSVDGSWANRFASVSRGTGGSFPGDSGTGKAFPQHTINIYSSSLVPATAEHRRAIAGAVSEALRRTGPAPAPRGR